MKTIYEYFKDFTKIETSFFRIERKDMKRKKDWQYLGVTIFCQNA